MPQRAKLLYTLQQIDVQLALRRRRYQKVEANLGESEALRKARASLEAAQKDHAHWRATLRDRELETESLAEKLRNDEQSLYSGRITNPRELSDLQRETEYLTRRKAELEDRQLEAMIALDDATTHLAVANEEYVVVEAGWKAENAELHQEYETLKRELAHLAAQRDKVIKRIRGEDMSEYNAIRRLRKGLAVVAVQKGVCKACNVSIPQRDLRRAAQTDELFYCSGCDRILYVPEN